MKYQVLFSVKNKKTILKWSVLFIVKLKCNFLKASYSSKNRYFIIRERSDNLIHGINTIIKCGT